MRRTVILISLLISLTPLKAKEGVIQCANLIYGGTHTSRCFSDEFLNALQKKTCIPTAKRFRSVKLISKEMFEFPFIVMTGEADFHLTQKGRKNFREYLERGGFVLASAGCSSKTWARAFRRELKKVFPKRKLTRIKMSHPLYHTVYSIKELRLAHAEGSPYLEGLEIDGKLVLVFSHHGLNNSKNAPGCCCCGENEILNSKEINVNILVYALLH